MKNTIIFGLTKTDLIYAFVAALCGIFFSIVSQVPLPRSNTLVVLVVGAVTVLAVHAGRRRLGAWGTAGVVFLGFFGAAISMSIFMSGIMDRFLLANFVKLFMIPLCGFLVFYQLRQRAIFCFVVFLLAFGLLNFLAVSYYFLKAPLAADGLGRQALNVFTGTEVRGTNAAASVFALCIALFFLNLIREWPLKFLALLGASCAVLFSMYIGTRGLVVATVPLFAVLFLLQLAAGRKGLMIFSGAAILVTAVALVAFSVPGIRLILVERMHTRFQVFDLADAEFSGRAMIWAHSLREAQASFFGKGFVYTDPMTGFSTHNTFLEIWISYGFPSLMIFLSILGYAFALSISRVRSHFMGRRVDFGPDLLLVSMMGYFMVEAHIYPLIGVYTFLFFYLGVMSGMHDDQSSKPSALRRRPLTLTRPDSGVPRIEWKQPGHVARRSHVRPIN